MLHEDPSDLADDGGMVLAQMAGRHEQLRHRAIQVRTLVRDQAVVTAAPGRVAQVRDDGMGLDRLGESEFVQAHEDGRSPLQFVDAGGQALAEVRREEVRAIAGNEPLVGRPQRVGEADEPRAQALQPAPVDATPRCGVAMKTTRRISGRGSKIRALRKSSRSSGSPASSSKGRSLTSRQSRVPLSWTIILASRPPMLWPMRTMRSNAASVPSGSNFRRTSPRSRQKQGRIRDRVARRVAEGPELIAIAKGRVGFQALDHPGPRPRAGPQAVDEDDWGLARSVRSEEGQPRRLESEGAREVRIRLRGRETERCARGFDPRRSLGPRRCRRHESRDRSRGSDHA